MFNLVPSQHSLKTVQLTSRALLTLPSLSQAPLDKSLFSLFTVTSHSYDNAKDAAVTQE